MSEGSRQLRAVFWFLIGGLTGAAVGLLLAPQSGRATRRLLARRAEEAADSAREAWDEAALRIGEAAAGLTGLPDVRPE